MGFKVCDWMFCCWALEIFDLYKDCTNPLFSFSGIGGKIDDAVTLTLYKILVPMMYLKTAFQVLMPLQRDKGHILINKSQD